jgi:hypothetical protein
LAILPPTVDAKAAALGTLDAETQARAVSVMLTHAASELAKATDAQSVLEWKAKAGAIQELTKQLQLGKELRLDAVEFVRGTERALGIAIREGQAAGTILGPGKKNFHAGGYALAKKQLNNELIPGPTEYATASELSGANQPGTGIYAMTDGVSDEQFKEALAEARAEGNLSRANVARKCRALAHPEPPAVIDQEEDETEQPDESSATKNNGPRHDSSAMVENIAGMLDSIVQTLGYIDPADIDPKVAKRAAPRIFAALNQIRKTTKEINNV